MKCSSMLSGGPQSGETELDVNSNDTHRLHDGHESPHLKEAIAAGQVQVGAVALDEVPGPAAGVIFDGTPHLTVVEPTPQFTRTADGCVHIQDDGLLQAAGIKDISDHKADGKSECAGVDTHVSSWCMACPTGHTCR